MDFSSFKNVNVIISFPSFGFSTNFASQFLIEKTDCKSIGHIFLEDKNFNFMTIHKGNPVWPFTIYYSKKNNFLLFNSLVNFSGYEFEIFNKIKSFLDKISFEKIFILEGIAFEGKEHKSFYYTLNEKFKKLFSKNIIFLEEAVILGISSLFFSFYRDNTIALFSLSNVNNIDVEASINLLNSLKDLNIINIDINIIREESKILKAYMNSILKKHSIAKTLKNREESTNYIG